MAGWKSDYLSSALLAHVFGNTPYTAPATLYCALSTTVPNRDGSNFTEPVGYGYARVAMTNDTTHFPAPALALGLETVHNGVDIAFPTATGSWGSIVWAGWYDAITGGNLLSAGPLNVVLPVGAGPGPTFAMSTGFTETES